MSDRIEISAIVPVCELYEIGTTLPEEYLAALEATRKPFELVYVLDGEHQQLIEQLAQLAAKDSRVRIIQLAKTFGESAALSAGFECSNGDVLLTLPAYSQIDPGAIMQVLAGLEHSDVSVAVRTTDNANGIIHRLRRRAFHKLVYWATGDRFRDMGCGVRGLTRNVAAELLVYGDQHRFFPILAARRGFKVAEVSVATTTKPQISARHGLRAYLARALDIFALIFLTRFMKKPLRFFGSIGTVLFLAGGIVLGYLVVQRAFFGVALADRPALMLSSLMVVLGLQVFALGLLGELIIFTHAKDMKEYTIERILN